MSPLAYLIVFNVSKKQFRVEIPSEPDGVPRWEFNHTTVFLVVINLQHEVASKAMANTVTITAGELVREVEEATQATAKGTP